MPSTSKERWRRVRAFAWRHAHLILPAAAAVLTFASTHILLGPVINRSGDNMYHLLNEFALLRGVFAGDDPLGPARMEFGQPLLRMYQALFYLYNIGVHLVTGADLKFLHNLTIVVCFALSPFGYLYFLRKLGLDRWTAGVAAFASMISVAAFGNSFEAYHQAGIVTQSMGGLFFPWFMGNFIGMLRGENRASTTGLLFALAFLSHAIMSVFAVFAGALYFAIAPVDLRRSWKKLAAFCAVGACLVAFWVLPFLDHTAQMRPVPDSIIRGGGVHWFTSVSKDELGLVLFSGRLLDDPPRKGDARNEDDRFMDKISIIGTLKTRPRAFSIMTALGVLFALVGFRRTPHRVLLGGFCFSLMLFAGPDDYRWLRFLPFIKQIQTFRCTYLIEFFAFGLAGLGVTGTLALVWRFVRGRRRFLRYPLAASWLVVLSGVLGFLGSEIVLLGQRHLRIRDPRNLDAMIDAMKPLPDQGYPFRTAPVYKGRFKLRQGWFAVHGYLPYCTHWKGTGPTGAFHLCQSLGSSGKTSDLHSLAGVRFYSGKRDKLKQLAKARDADRDSLVERLPNGKDRRGKGNKWHRLLDTGRDTYLRPLVGKPLPVVGTHSQWIWMAKEWTSRYRKWLWEETTPITLRVRAGQVGASGVLEHTEVLVYMDHSALERDRSALERFVASGGMVISPKFLPGIETTVPGPKDRLWKLLPTTMQRPKTAKPEKQHRDRDDPGLNRTWIKQLDVARGSVQRFSFDVTALEPLVAILPMEAAPGWTALNNGEPHPIFSAGPDLVGTILPRGDYRLTFRWVMPRWHRGTLYVSAAALVFVAGVWLVAIVRRFAPRRER